MVQGVCVDCARRQTDNPSDWARLTHVMYQYAYMCSSHVCMHPLTVCLLRWEGLLLQCRTPRFLTSVEWIYGLVLSYCYHDRYVIYVCFCIVERYVELAHVVTITLERVNLWHLHLCIHTLCKHWYYAAHPILTLDWISLRRFGLPEHLYSVDFLLFGSKRPSPTKTNFGITLY